MRNLTDIKLFTEQEWRMANSEGHERKKRKRKGLGGGSKRKTYSGNLPSIIDVCRSRLSCSFKEIHFHL